jgi:gas vesicle protein
MKNLLIGLVSGVALGMLFAPEKGSTFRERLSNSNNKLKEFSKSLAIMTEDASDEIKSFINSKDIQDLITKGSDYTKLILEKGSDLSKQGKEELLSVLEKVKKNTEKLSFCKKK